jgi:hypothetical protein
MPVVKSKAYVMLILGIVLDQKSAKYFLRKTHFRMTIFEFAAVWSPLPPPPARVAEYTLTVHKGISTLCRIFRVPQYKKTEEVF